MSETSVTAPAGQQVVIVSRVFDAPRDLVFQAFTEPELIPDWWGPSRLSTTVDKMDVRPGGSWRFVHRDTDGSEYGFHGVYHDVTAPERVVQTFEFEGVPGHVALETATFEDLGGGRTRYTGQSVYQSVEDRDAMVASGMESGARETMDRLAEILAKG
jgi:uncharacterized protein YndB with AHSA1/START domain